MSIVRLRISRWTLYRKQGLPCCTFTFVVIEKRFPKIEWNNRQTSVTSLKFTPRLAVTTKNEVEPSNKLSAGVCIYRVDSISSCLHRSIWVTFWTPLSSEEKAEAWPNRNVESALTWGGQMEGHKDRKRLLGSPKRLWKKEIWRRGVDPRINVV